jgi:hypothetical protein
MRGIAPMAGYEKPAQKTWTQLVGPYLEGDQVDGRMWVRALCDSKYKVLWLFDTPEEAEECFLHWRRGG